MILNIKEARVKAQESQQKNIRKRKENKESHKTDLHQRQPVELIVFSKKHMEKKTKKHNQLLMSIKRKAKT